MLGNSFRILPTTLFWKFSLIRKIFADLKFLCSLSILEILLNLLISGKLLNVRMIAHLKILRDLEIN